MRILVVSDGRRGIANQALGLAEAVARQTEASCEVTTHILNHGPVFAALPPSLQLAARRDFGLPDAELVIGCGRQAIAPLIALRRSGSAAFTVFVQHPRTDPSRFDLVIAPEHDGLDGPFVETMIGSPSRITRDRIVTGTLAHAERLRALPMPRAMLAIGGPSRTHALSSDTLAQHIEAARTLAAGGYSLLITTSRRTSDTAQAAWQDFARQSDTVWLHTPDSVGENPYLAFLGGAEMILVTEDSTNMLTEACATGKPVFRLPMDGRPGKFQTLYDALAERCSVRVWGVDRGSSAYKPLDETSHIAAILLRHLQAQPHKFIRS